MEVFAHFSGRKVCFLTAVSMAGSCRFVQYLDEQGSKTTMLDIVVRSLVSCDCSRRKAAGWLFEAAPETTRAHLV
jgi:hypothetical protein